MKMLSTGRSHAGLVSAITALCVVSFSMTATAQTPAPEATDGAAKTAEPAKKKAATPAPDKKAAAPARPATAAPAAAAPAADGSDTPADGAAPDAAPEPPPPPPPGFVVVNVDAEGLSAVVGGEVHGLKKGDNRFELPAGATTVDVQGKDGKSLQKFPVTVESGKDSQVAVRTTGKLVVNGAALSVQVDGKPVVAKDGSVSADLALGKHSVVVTQPGRVGIKSDIEVMAGKTHTIAPNLANFDAGNTSIAMGAVLGGGGLIIAAMLLERFGTAGGMGGEATRWVMVGGGIAGFAGGTMMMKGIYKRRANPPVEDGKLDVQVSERSSTTAPTVAAR